MSPTNVQQLELEMENRNGVQIKKLVWVAQFSQRPIKTYLIICFVVLILSLFLPMKIPTPSVAISSKLTLVMMHIIGAVAVVGVVVTLCR